MEPGGSMPHSQGLSNNSYSEQNKPNSPRIDTYLFKVHSDIVFPSTPRPPQRSFPLGLPVKILKALLPSSIVATCPAHLNLLDLITLTILGERYKLRSFSLWSLVHFPFSSLLGPNIRLRILFSQLNKIQHYEKIWSSLNSVKPTHSLILLSLSVLCQEYYIIVQDQDGQMSASIKWFSWDWANYDPPVILSFLQVCYWIQLAAFWLIDVMTIYSARQLKLCDMW